jgi:hypothetical protein
MPTLLIPTHLVSEETAKVPEDRACKWSGKVTHGIVEEDVEYYEAEAEAENI